MLPQAVIALMVGTCSVSHWGQRSTRTKKEPVGSLVIFGVEVGYQVDQLPAVSSENMDRAQLPHERPATAEDIGFGIRPSRRDRPGIQRDRSGIQAVVGSTQDAASANAGIATRMDRMSQVAEET